MKRCARLKKGFTLLEIIVVMIIVGVLAAIALPNLFANIERQRINEAMKNIPMIRTAVDACIATNGGNVWNAGCALVANVPAAGLNINLPAPAGTMFSYTVASAAAASYNITAIRTAANTPAAAGAVVNDGVDLGVTIANGTTVRNVVDAGVVAVSPGTGTFQAVW